jgi:uncharacterized protein
MGLPMRNLVAGSLAAAALSFALIGAPALAADATVDQVYSAVRAGRLADAQQMMDQVLHDHPESAKAHFVQAELYAREGNAGLARSELARAEQLKPGLPEVNPESVRELKQELGVLPRGGSERSFGTAPGLGAPAAHHFPWGAVILLLLVIGVFAMLFRRRTYVQYPAGPGPVGGPGGYGPGYMGPGGGGYVGPAPGGGIGSNIAGGLAGGLAAGAGIVAGEELAHHFLDGNERAAVAPPRDDDEFRNANNDLGGNDFGVNDPGSWDDGGSGGGDFGGGDSGGGGDWS